MKQKRIFKQLDQGRRDRIESLWLAGTEQKDIAVIVGCHKSTVSREIRNRQKRDGVYSAETAQLKAQVARSNSKYQGMRIEQDQDLKLHIVEELRKHRSPDEIAGRMKEEGRSPSVSTPAIYRWLYSSFGQQYCKYLCTHRHKKKPSKGRNKRHMIRNMKSVHDIPKSVLTHSDISEGDTFVSPKKLKTTAAAVVVVKRKTKYISGNKIPSLETKHMTASVQRIQRVRPSDVLILDRGVENRGHEHFGVDTYFCDPHAPHQKPLAEGSIGLIRRWFFPKGTNLEQVTEEELQDAFRILNNKYRKSLRYRSAQEMEDGCDILRD